MKGSIDKLPLNSAFKMKGEAPARLMITCLDNHKRQNLFISITLKMHHDFILRHVKKKKEGGTF